MNRFVWVGVLLTVLLAQSAPAASCFSKAPSMPCCTPDSHCATPGVNAPSCCGLDGPADRQDDADRHRATPPPSPERQAVTVPHAQVAADGGIAPAGRDLAGSPPRDPGVPLYLRLGALLI